MNEILEKTYYGNTVMEWLIALVIIAAAFFGAKILYWVLSRIVRAVTKKTKTRLDDIIVDMVEEPAVFIATVAGIWYGLNRLNMNEQMESWVGAGTQMLVILSVAWLISRLLDSFYEEYLVPLAEKTENTLDDQLLPILRRSTRLIVWSLGLVVALNNAGYDVGALIAGLGIGGLALAMAAKDTVSNIFGGFTIFVDKPFALNDRIMIAGFDGIVSEIGLRSTRLRTLAGRLVTIPNAVFAESAVENISAEPNRKVSMTLGLTYDTSTEQMKSAMSTLREIVDAHQATEETVLVSFTAFGDFALSILFIYYIKNGEDILQTQTEINLEILQRFNAQALDFAFPTQTLYTINKQEAS